MDTELKLTIENITKFINDRQNSIKEIIEMQNDDGIEDTYHRGYLAALHLILYYIKKPEIWEDE